MKVKVVKADIDNWYKIGEVHEVENRVAQYDGYKMYPLIEDKNAGIDPDDCVIVGDTLPAETFLVGEKPSEHFVTEADKLAMRMEMATRMAANIPEKTLWDEYAIPVLQAIVSDQSNLVLSPERIADMVKRVVDSMMESRKVR
jgi:hypothetical protein